jgi:predicted phosphoribosyltransferase
MVFENRVDAGRQLTKALRAYQGQHPLILAIPRGGVPLGREIADALGGELDVVLVRKLGAPYNPEFAVGSIGESGQVFVADYAERAGANSRYIAEEADRQLATIRRRRAQYARVQAPISVKGRTVIVVDDGLATGATMRSALQEVRSQQPTQLICAIPVASPEAIALVQPLCDELVCLQIEAEFGGVGRFYVDFRQVEDDEAVALLAGQQ